MKVKVGKGGILGLKHSDYLIYNDLPICMDGVL